MVLPQTWKEILTEEEGSGGSFYGQGLVNAASKPLSWKTPNTRNLLSLTADLAVTVCFQCHLFPTDSDADSLEGISMGEGRASNVLAAGPLPIHCPLFLMGPGSQPHVCTV